LAGCGAIPAPLAPPQRQHRYPGGAWQRAALCHGDGRPSSDRRGVTPHGPAAEQSLAEGAFGISTVLIYAPCAYADTRELIYLNRTVAKYGSLFVTHMRNEADYIWSALNEVFEVAHASEVAPHLPLLLANYPEWPGLSDLLWPTSTQECGFHEFANSILNAT